jgi:sigma-E factor negative regulatory protein RseB
MVGARHATGRLRRRAGLAVAMLFVVPVAFGDDAAGWLQRASTAARQLNYMGTVAYEHDSRVETSRLIHLFDANGEAEKLSSLDGPAQESFRVNEQIRCFYPDAKVMRIDARTSHNAFPSLLPQQVNTLAAFYTLRKAEIARVAGLQTQAYVFEPKDNVRYGHKFWADIGTGLLLKARLLDEKNSAVEQFAFSEIQIGVKLDRDAVQPMFTTPPADWQVIETQPGDVAPKDTGWTVKYVPPGFTKVIEGMRKFHDKSAPVAHLVFSDGLVAISVFVEPTPAAPQAVGSSQEGGVNFYRRQLDDHLVTVLGEAPGATVRQIAYSVSHR